MILINLLPHREEKRAERRRGFFASVAVVIVIGLGIAFLIHSLIASLVEAQESRNAIFTREIARLDEEIAEIKRLREQIDALLARKQVIESLQSHRAETVHVFNELARLVPEGVSLKSVKQSGLKLTLVGYAQSNARVSTLMRSLEASPYLERAELVEIKTASLDKRRVGEFQLDISIERVRTDRAGDTGAGAAR